MSQSITAVDYLSDQVTDWQRLDYTPFIVGRVKKLAMIRNNEQALQAAVTHYKTHPDGCVHFIEDWLWTYDPRRLEDGRDPAVPFLLFPKQREYVRWVLERIRNREPGLVEKSRDAGATFVNIGIALWMWLFWPGAKVGIGSRKEILVDRDGDMDSIFEKARWMINRLPKELLPAGFVPKKHCANMRIVNPETDAAITGEAGDNIGRGGRNLLYIKDESAFYERPDKIEAALSQNTNVKIDVSTPHGTNNPFYRKRFSGKIQVFTFHWRDDPRKDEVWYKKQQDELEPHILAQEVDLDYHASLEGVLIPARWVQAAVGIKLPGIGDKRIGNDVADETGKDLSVAVYRHGPRVKGIKAWKNIDVGDMARRVFALGKACDIDFIFYDAIGVGAGARAEYKSAMRRDGETYTPKIHGVTVGSPPVPGWTSGKRNKDMYKNLKAQLAWELRKRFERTYKHVTGKRKYEPEEMISIPNHPQLIAELSQPTWSTDSVGRLVIDKAPNGAKSPDYFEALLLSYGVEQKVAIA